MEFAATTQGHPLKPAFFEGVRRAPRVAPKARILQDARRGAEALGVRKGETMKRALWILVAIGILAIAGAQAGNEQGGAPGNDQGGLPGHDQGNGTPIVLTTT